MNDITFFKIKKARVETEQEIVSENLKGIDFNLLIQECDTTNKSTHSETKNFDLYAIE